MGDFSVKAVLSAVDKNFSSTMKSALGYTNNLKSTLTSGIGFGAMMAIGQKAVSVVGNAMSGLSKETISTSDSMYKLQAAMRFSGYSEKEIERIAGATGSLKTYADKTVFSLQDVMSTFGALSANGIKDADKLTEAVGNAVAVFGGGAQEYSSVALAFSQAMAAGALHAQDWNQILNASPQLAGGLRKELIRLNPALGTDFKGAMEKGAISADLLAEAMNNIGMTDMAKEAATSVTTFEGAMGNLEATAVSGMMKLYDTFAKTAVIDAINGFNDKVGAGFEWLAGAIPVAIEKIKPYWDVFKADFIEVKDAFGEAVSAITGEVEKLTGSFGSTDSVKNFSDVIGMASGALTTFAGFCEKHADVIAKVLTVLPKLLIAYKGFKILKAVAPFVGTFSKGILMLAGKGVGTIAGKLFGIAGAEKETGEASMTSAKQMMQSAAAFLMLGAGVALIAGGFALLAYSSIQLANAGPLAIGVMAGMTVAVGALLLVAKAVAPALTEGAVGFVAFGAAVILAGVGIMILTTAAVNLANAGPLAIAVMAGMVLAIAGLAVGAALLGPALTAGAIGFIVFGAAILLVGAGALLASAALAVVAAVLPVIVAYGLQGAVAIGALALGLTAFAAGAALAGAGCIVLGAGLATVALGLGLIAAVILVVAAGVLALSAGTLILGAGMTLTASALMMAAVALPMVSIGALTCVAAFAALLATSLALTASLTLLAVPLALVGATAVISTVGLAAFALAMTTGCVGVLAMAAALKAVNSSMKSIAGNAKSAKNSISSMVSGIDVVNSGLDALGNKAKSAVNKLTSAFSGGAGKAQAAGKALATGAKNGVQSGLVTLPVVAITAMNAFNGGLRAGSSAATATARSMSSNIISAMRSSSSGSYNCGYNIGIGLANGMRSTLGTVRSVAAQLAAAAEAAIRAKAKIHSPSRVSGKLGEYFGVGWVNSLLGMVKKSRRAAEELVSVPDIRPFPEMQLAYAGANGAGILDSDYRYSSDTKIQVEVPVNLDGREVARVSTPYIKSESDKIDSRNNRKSGRR